jgi:hypothetical protein
MDVEIIRDGDFHSGFVVGYRSIRGTTAPLPAIPVAPVTRENSTRFLMGVRRGIERAVGRSIDEIRKTS